MSPCGQYDNELKKQPSVSSLRDALLSTTNSGSQQQYAPYSPRIPGGHPSPMTPSTNFPHTPDASTPAGGSSIMSPHMQPRFEDKNDGHISTDSEIMNSFTQPIAEEDSRSLRVSPFQVESILGIHNDKPIEQQMDANLGEVNSVNTRKRNTILSPDGIIHESSEPAHENNMHAVNKNDSKQMCDPPPSPSLSKVDTYSESQIKDGAVMQVCCTKSLYIFIYIYIIE